MEPSSWEITVVTPGKLYKGRVFGGYSMDKRTLTLLNTSAKTSKASDSTLALEGFIQLEDATVSVGNIKKGLSSVSIRKSEIIFALDEFKSMGSDTERKRFQSWYDHKDTASVSIITKLRAGQSFQLTGQIFQFKQKFLHKDHFIPMTRVSVEKIITRKDAPVGPPTKISFAAVNKAYIEAISLQENGSGSKRS